MKLYERVWGGCIACVGWLYCVCGLVVLRVWAGCIEKKAGGHKVHHGTS